MQTEKILSTNWLWFLGAWFATAITALIFSIALMFYLSIAKVVTPSSQNFKLYSAIPSQTIVTTDNIVTADARAKIIANFFTGHKAPLSDFADDFVKVADQYQLDYRLLPAIAMQESNGGKKVIRDSKNPFGYGIYGNLVVRFNSWEEAIERVGEALREDYLNKGLYTPGQIMTKYTPPSAAKDGKWATAVYTFMDELR